MDEHGGKAENCGLRKKEDGSTIKEKLKQQYTMFLERGSREEMNKPFEEIRTKMIHVKREIAVTAGQKREVWPETEEGGRTAEAVFRGELSGSHQLVDRLLNYFWPNRQVCCCVFRNACLCGFRFSKMFAV